MKPTYSVLSFRNILIMPIVLLITWPLMILVILAEKFVQYMFIFEDKLPKFRVYYYNIDSDKWGYHDKTGNWIE